MDEKENPESRFQAEMIRKVDLIIQKLGTHDERFNSVDERFNRLEQDVSEIKGEVSEIKSDVKVLKGQFNDVAVMAIDDTKRITKLEADVKELQSNSH